MTSGFLIGMKNNVLPPAVKPSGLTEQEQAIVSQLLRQLRNGTPLPSNPPSTATAIPPSTGLSSIPTPLSDPPPPLIPIAPLTATAPVRSYHGLTINRTASGPPLPQSAPTVGLQMFPGANFMSNTTNQRRMEAAQRHRTVTPARPARRGRGSAQHPPGLGHSSVVQHNVPQHANVRVLLYPHLSEGPDRTSRTFPLAHHRRLQEFITHLDSLNLTALWQDVPLTTTLPELIGRAVSEFEQGPLQADFRQSSSLALPLAPLVPRNRGREYGNPLCRRLQYRNVDQRETLQNMLQRRSLFSISPEICQEPSSDAFIFRLTPTLTGMTGVIPSSEDPQRRHSCIGRRVWHRFDSDDLTTANDHDQVPCSDVDSDFDSEDAIEQSIALRTRSSHIRTSNDRVRQVLPQAAPLFSEPYPQQRSHAHLATHSLMSFIRQVPEWASNSFYPSTVRPMGADTPYTPQLAISGPTLEAAADDLRYIMVRCHGEGVSDMLLTTNRLFRIDTPSMNSPIGEGVEREVIQTLVQRTLESSQNLLDRPNDFKVFCPSTWNPRIPSSREQLSSAFVTGATISLSVIRLGCLPPKYSPLQYIYLLNNGDHRCLTEELLNETSPELLGTVCEWQAVGSEGDLRPFSGHLASYLDIDVNRFLNRSEQAHIAMEKEILLMTLFGTATPLDHPEMDAFRAGLRLDCSNGFNLVDAIQSFSGGPHAFIRNIQLGRISSFGAIANFLDIREPPTPLLAELRDIPNHTFDSFGHFLQSYLDADGAPSVDLALEERTNGIIDFQDMDLSDNGFRSRTFYRAVTGCNQIQHEARRIKVTFIGPQYSTFSGLTAAEHQSIVMGETLFYRTCFGSVWIPASAILRLLRNDNPDATRAQGMSGTTAAFHWLFSNILSSAQGGVGGAI